jgi:hypothetical protein
MSIVLTFNTRYTITPNATIRGIVFNVTNNGRRLTSQSSLLASVPDNFLDGNFRRSNLTNATLGNTITSIGSNAFFECSSLTSFVIPRLVTSIGTSAFASTTLLRTITFDPSNVITNIGASAFNNATGLTSISLPNTVTSIGNNAFQGCTALTSFVIPRGVTSIGFLIFQNNTLLSKITFDPSNVITNISDYSFYEINGLTSITLPNTVTGIGVEAFYSCPNLTSFVIPSAVTSIGASAFRQNTNLRTFAFLNQANMSVNPGTNVFQSDPSMSVIYYNTASSSNLSSASLSLQSQFPSDSTFTYIATPRPNPTITNFPNLTKNINTDPSFTLVDPSSNSTGAFTYTSSNTSVASISGNVVTLVGSGNSVLIATQQETPYYNQGTINASLNVIAQVDPTITNFPTINKIFGDAPFTLVDPSSNSAGAFTYTISDTSVATISGNVVTIVSPGSAVITASQAATPNYYSGSVDASLNVSQSTPNNPTGITNPQELEYFLTTQAEYANITTNITINTDSLSSTTEKIFFNNSSSGVEIKR